LSDYIAFILNVNSVKVAASMAAQIGSRRGRPAGEGEQGAATRTAILDAAEQRFADDGAAARLQDIAADAGKTAPAVAHFFQDKATLQKAVITRLAADFSCHLAACSLPAGSGGVARVMALIEGVMTFMRKRPALLGFILRDMAEGRLHPLSQGSWTYASAPYAQMLEEAVLEDGVPPSVDATINITAGPMVFFMVRAARYSDAEFETAMHRQLDVIRKALTAILRG
jgi:AcrR family transcriptional regulator